MDRQCTQCNEFSAVTDCDKCDKRTCRKCATVVSLPKGEIMVKHSNCVSKKRTSQ